MNKNFFPKRHPLVYCIYYSLLFLMLMSTIHPFIIGTCFIGSSSFYIMDVIKTKKSIRRHLKLPIVVLLVMTVTNPLFVHSGSTVLCRVMNKPITLEAMMYGFFIGLMLLTVYILFQNIQTVIDIEAFFYLFSQRFPNLAIILSLIFRLIPLFQAYLIEIKQVHHVLQPTAFQTIRAKVSYNVDLFNNFFSWALENTIDTADAMQSRGYGLQKRSSYLTFQWRMLDYLSVLWLAFFAIIYFSQLMQGKFTFNYYPYFQMNFSDRSVYKLSDLGIVLLVMWPTIKAIKEEIQWHILKSAI